MTTWLRTLFGLAESGLDLAVLVTNIQRIHENVTKTVDGLSPDIKARFKKKANFRVFAQAMDMLKIQERDAIEDILAELFILDKSQAMQERFILQAVLTGPTMEDTAIFLRGLATRSTSEAVAYLVMMDYTQEPATLGWVQTVLNKSPNSIKDANKWLGKKIDSFESSTTAQAITAKGQDVNTKLKARLAALKK